MSRVFITGSSTGLGLMAGRLLAEQGHEVVLHARDERRAGDARTALPAAADIVIGDAMTEQLNRMGRFDAVIHNVGVGYREPRRILTEDGLPHVFAINVIAPYVLTALMTRPTRLVYLSSGMHQRVQVVPTRMGGPDAPDDINQAHLTQAWLAVSSDPAALVTGQYFYHMRPRQPNSQAFDTALQDGLVDGCERLSGVKLPV
jgi:NAD(P)-dependent dehydrogenase (short-subunit alcohol dehydrogenase family)